MNNAKYVTRRAKLRMMNTFLNHGKTATETHACTTDRRWMEKMRALKTTKFIQSSPIVIFKGESHVAVLMIVATKTHRATVRILLR